MIGTYYILPLMYNDVVDTSINIKKMKFPFDDKALKMEEEVVLFSHYDSLYRFINTKLGVTEILYKPE